MNINLLKIQRFSIHDGPGIRTTVFFKGCPLRCRWCHNPESIPAPAVFMWNERLCTLCGLCGLVDKDRRFHHPEDVNLDKYRNICVAGALTVHGFELSIEAVMEQIRKDRDYYENSGGGVTFSGGEPLQQPDAAVALAAACHAENFQVYLDTSGFANEAVFTRVAAAVDGFLFDVKLMDPVLHREFTGVDNTLIFENFQRAVAGGKPVRMRVVLIPGLTDTPANLAALVKLIHETGFIGPVDLMPYHNMGSGKYRHLGLVHRMNGCKAPSKKQIADVVNYLKRNGIAAGAQ